MYYTVFVKDLLLLKWNMLYIIIEFKYVEKIAKNVSDKLSSNK